MCVYCRSVYVCSLTICAGRPSWTVHRCSPPPCVCNLPSIAGRGSGKVSAAPFLPHWTARTGVRVAGLVPLVGLYLTPYPFCVPASSPGPTPRTSRRSHVHRLTILSGHGHGPPTAAVAPLVPRGGDLTPPGSTPGHALLI